MTVTRDSLAELFEYWERTRPDLMEPFSIRLADATTAPERIEIMRDALASTINQRFPLP